MGHATGTTDTAGCGDSTFTLQALLGTGYIAEAKAWREWLLRAVAGAPADLQIMYALDGTRRIPEYVLDWLPGYEESAPVRIGNAASTQLQLDVWGEVLDGLHQGRLVVSLRPSPGGTFNAPCWITWRGTGGRMTTAYGRCVGLGDRLCSFER